ncbi:3-oxoacyl-[acyl-carrier-protein] reductase FabG [Hypsizygus marmoreus]|uniref:3-oxoacyl-[acyl-carrier-protein] reductase FabG n=1 Tax=Hypsizygus marmoreus TaxID=39966 RepID=A0A369JZD0_HYPMA|nr:3-oxoacyl-[acyl-carrier-protein] reductase FabG [Hypsizygus marmoreus]
MSGYNKTRHQQPSAEELYKVTTARLQKIQSQLADAPQGIRLKDKICVITGVGSLKGIGRATAIRFAHEGAKHLYLIDFDGTNLPNLKSTIETTYPDVKVTTLQADAADEAAISGVCEQALREEGRLDVFYANAGVASRNALADTSAETFMNSMRVNALSCFLAVKYASAAMKKTNPSRGKENSGGSIIMTASTAGLRSGAGTVDYSASKAAVNSIAKTSAYQLQKTDIRVNSICPGLIETGMTGETFEYARQRGSAGKIGQLNPMGRYGIPEEIAQAAVFLASDDSSYVNGQNIAVDGGLSASHPVAPGRWV